MHHPLTADQSWPQRHFMDSSNVPSFSWGEFITTTLIWNVLSASKNNTSRMGAARLLFQLQTTAGPTCPGRPGPHSRANSTTRYPVYFQSYINNSQVYVMYIVYVELDVYLHTEAHPSNTHPSFSPLQDG